MRMIYQAQLARPETSLNFFLTGGLRPPDPPISRPGGLPIWSLTGFGQPNTSLNFFFAPDGKDPGNVPFGTGGSEVVRDGKFPGNFNSGSLPKTYSYASSQMAQ